MCKGWRTSTEMRRSCSGGKSSLLVTWSFEQGAANVCFIQRRDRHARVRWDHFLRNYVTDLLKEIGIKDVRMIVRSARARGREWSYTRDSDKVKRLTTNQRWVQDEVRPLGINIQNFAYETIIADMSTHAVSKREMSPCVRWRVKVTTRSCPGVTFIGHLGP